MRMLGAENSYWSSSSDLRVPSCCGFEFGAAVKQIQVVVRVGLKPRTTGLCVQHTDHSLMPSPIKDFLFLVLLLLLSFILFVS